MQLLLDNRALGTLGKRDSWAARWSTGEGTETVKGVQPYLQRGCGGPLFR